MSATATITGLSITWLFITVLHQTLAMLPYVLHHIFTVVPYVLLRIALVLDLFFIPFVPSPSPPLSTTSLPPPFTPPSG